MNPGKYFEENCCICRNTKEGNDQLTNFTAQIAKELIYHDGPKTITHLEITGRLRDDTLKDNGEPKYPDGKPLPNVTIPATDFATMGWVAEAWGLQPIIFPVSNAERDLRTAIQLSSRPEKEHIYTHTGWTEIKGEPHYLTASGGLHRGGLNKAIKVSLPHELRNYSLPAPNDDKAPFLDSLRLVNVGPPHVMWIALLTAYRAAIGPADYGVHIAGRTGTYKSELASLIQSHYGEQMHAKALPASWSSTGNALESLCYRAANTVIVLDDFVPTGTAYHVRQLQKTADQLIRGQGNQAGRARMNDVSQMQTTYYPRGIILSTGEDIPEGHSVRGRMMICELSPGEIETAKLTVAQQRRPSYSQAMANWIRWLAATSAREYLPRLATDYRDKHLGVGHTRTPGIIGNLMATAHLLGEFAIETNALDVPTISDIVGKANAAILAAATRQVEHLEAADPVEALTSTIRMLTGSKMAHFKSRTGGTPKNADKYGYTAKETDSDLPTYERNGPPLGWVDASKGELYLDPNMIPLLKKHSGGRLALTPQTLLKRMKESGLITRIDNERQRNTVRMTLEGHVRQVLCLDLPTVFDEGA
jgi:hypothetical protein